MVDVADARENYCSHFARLEEEATRDGGSWTYPIRKAAISRFAEQGFPTTRHEEWKYTNVAPVLKIPFKRAGYKLNGLTPETVKPFRLGREEGRQLVFVNGYYSPELSLPWQLPDGVKAGSLAAALESDAREVEPHLARYASYQDHAFVALNTAFMEDGAFVYIPRGRSLEGPIHLLFISTAHGGAGVSYPRNLIVVGDDSQATIVERYAGLGPGVYFTNGVTEVIAGENAVIDHYKLEEESSEAFHISTLQVHLNRSSRFSSHSITLGGALVRSEINTVLDGEGGECTLNGLYMASGQQHVDNQTRIDHVKPHCTSRELYKGILDGRARGVFNGKIFVHPSAPKTDAKQTNKNLLLSREAWIDTKPQLEIHNNDVKCAHGSTIGQLDQDALFYLRSRGVGLRAARGLLTYAFASEIVGRIHIEPLRARLEESLVARFREGEATAAVV
jgi:Fe-S cluster assembly protein SufD